MSCIRVDAHPNRAAIGARKGAVADPGARFDYAVLDGSNLTLTR